MNETTPTPPLPLRVVLREWGRIGLMGFGGPPAHVALLRELCVERRGWIDGRRFADANAACGLAPGPASTQLAIYLAHHLAGWRGALVGGLAFIVPGLLAILVLSAVYFDGTPSSVVRGIAAGAGAAVVAVVGQAGVGLGRDALAGRTGAVRARTVLYGVTAAAVTLVAGAWVVLALVGCGVVELVLRRGGHGDRLLSVAFPAAAAAVFGVAAMPALLWMALKVGALSYGGGFVIVPLMHADAVGNGWVTDAQFTAAVALGQLTPGPVVQTVAVVGYAAAGIGGALAASVVAFAPSFAIVLLGGERFERARSNATARAFLDGAGPAAVGAIFGAAATLVTAVDEAWQLAVLIAAAVSLITGRVGVVAVLVGAGVAGALAAALGAAVPG